LHCGADEWSRADKRSRRNPRTESDMHVISRKKLREFWNQHDDAEPPLRAWYKVVKHANWETFADVRATYSSADQVGKFVVFNIGGNKYRLVTVIHYDRAKVYIRHVLSHTEYDRGDWKED
jgi:mRNA interferase HigB